MKQKKLKNKQTCVESVSNQRINNQSLVDEG